MPSISSSGGSPVHCGPIVSCLRVLTTLQPTAVQFVFALTRGADGLVGGRLYRSDYYGKADTWDDRTNEMTGEHAVSSSVAQAFELIFA